MTCRPGLCHRRHACQPIAVPNPLFTQASSHAHGMGDFSACATCVCMCYLCLSVLPVSVCATCVCLCYLCWCFMRKPDGRSGKREGFAQATLNRHCCLKALDQLSVHIHGTELTPALDRQDLSCTYLAHHELESVISILTVAVGITIGIIIVLL